MNREIEISTYGSLLVYKKGYTPDFVNSVIQEHKLRGLRIFAQLKDDRLPDLDFLSEYSFLEALDITSIDDYNFNFLFSLKGLKDLTINIYGKNTIDLSNQVSLCNLTIQLRNRKILGLDKCSHITSLCLVEYSEEDFTSISSLRSLNDLRVKTASIKSVKGLECLTELKTLFLGNCKKLVSINNLENLINLTSLSIEQCPQIKVYDTIGHLLNLENLLISDCKGVDTIKFIQKLPSLKRIVLLGNTDILDGDMLSIKDIKEVLYKHRKHYNTKIENKDYEQLINSNITKVKGLFK